jgi:transposase
VGGTTAQVFIAETGGDLSRFPSAAHLASWTGVAPAIHESAGQRSPAGTRHGSKFLTSMLVEAANSAARTKNTCLGAQFARIASRRGHNGAAVAAAHPILVSAYHMLIRDEPYHDVGAGWLDDDRAEVHTRRLLGQLEWLGHKVVLDPAS